MSPPAIDVCMPHGAKTGERITKGAPPLGIGVMRRTILEVCLFNKLNAYRYDSSKALKAWNRTLFEDIKGVFTSWDLEQNSARTFS
ncbi:hypothetical protein DL766_007077 [Monosporascus sp. MC13-8B]|nr:hypothetical protein DL763_005498 [Monosporascus cannonballus]RYP25358.1 hypothetical protein DL766_007077 [Monosporascus sp. MC13-8B]